MTHLYLSPSPTFYSISTWLPSLRNDAVDQGRLDDGRRVAVKQLSVGKSGQGESEFFVEVNMITSIQHKNLVRLVGCCSEGSQRLLVYEFMKNKSLDKILFGKHA